MTAANMRTDVPKRRASMKIWLVKSPAEIPLCSRYCSKLAIANKRMPTERYIQVDVLPDRRMSCNANMAVMTTTMMLVECRTISVKCIASPFF